MDLSESGFARDQLDYTTHPPSLSRGVEAALGRAAMGVVALGLLWWVVLAAKRDRRATGDLAWVVPFAWAGFGVGVIWRVMTAGVIGANIGAGLAIMFGVPCVLVLITIGVVLLVSPMRRRRTGLAVGPPGS